MKKKMLILLLGAFTYSATAQRFSVPDNYAFKTAEDYARHDETIIQCVDWLLETPVNEQTAKRKEANAYLLQWLTGTPDVHIEINPEIITFMNTSPELMLIFMGGWAKYSLENNSDDKIEGSLAGIEAVITFYARNVGKLSSDKNVEKYIKLKDKGKLRAFIEKNA